LIAHAVIVELVAAVAGQLERHELRILAVGDFDDELALGEPLGDLLGLVRDM
jgi:hypothetical protein